jgi:hypothetical protein
MSDIAGNNGTLPKSAIIQELIKKGANESDKTRIKRKCPNLNDNIEGNRERSKICDISGNNRK